MFRRIKFQMPIAWAVLFAVLFNIALPTLAAIQANTSDTPFVTEICTATGTKKVVVSGASTSPADPTNLLHEGHCQLCPSGVAASPVPATAIVLPLAFQPPHQWAPLPPTPVSQRNGCPPPPSHAPPAFS
ncbi:hypothetical protein GCM10027343_15010 [Noviherbaspirillum agri]